MFHQLIVVLIGRIGLKSVLHFAWWLPQESLGGANQLTIFFIEEAVQKRSWKHFNKSVCMCVLCVQQDRKWIPLSVQLCMAV